MQVMARTIALARHIGALNAARTIIVSACAIALIVAERFAPVF
ncbi:MAG: hypothetical protein VX072_00330 [Pseudomonadota bacterium]|nr:hypothetical protein [Pseudomonadota bacterium]